MASLQGRQLHSAACASRHSFSEQIDMIVSHEPALQADDGICDDVRAVDHFAFFQHVTMLLDQQPADVREKETPSRVVRIY